MGRMGLMGEIGYLSEQKKMALKKEKWRYYKTNDTYLKWRYY